MISAKFKLYPKKWQLEKMETIRREMQNLYCELTTCVDHYYSGATAETGRHRWIMTEHRGPVVKDKTMSSFLNKIAMGRKYVGGTRAAKDVVKRVEQSWTDYWDNKKEWSRKSAKKKAELWDSLTPASKRRRQARGINDARPLRPERKPLWQYPGWGYREKIGWKIELSERHDGKGYHRLHIKGVTDSKDKSTWIRMRGGAKAFGEMRNLVITKDKCGDWWAVVGMRVEIKREHGDAPIAYDWGTTKLITLSNGDVFPNPRHANKYRERKTRLKQELARKKKGSNARRKVKGKLSRLERKIANTRRSHMHQVTHDVVDMAGAVVTEELNIRGMTATAKGTEEKPGKKVKQKAGLNRSILDSAPGMLNAMMEAKCKEAGIDFIKVDTLRIAPSQTCAQCGSRQKMPRKKRVYECPVCGWVCERDKNAAMVMLKEAYK